MNKTLLAAVLAAAPFLAHAEHTERIELDEVRVTAPLPAFPVGASATTKTDTPLMETPISIQVVPQSVLVEQNAQKTGDVVKNVSGVQSMFFYGGASEVFLIRGFQQSAMGYRNGARVPVKKFDLANIDRVEVLKGPASMLYGPGDPSGMINYVTKKPQKTTYYSLEQTVGMFDNYRTEVSATGAIDDDGIWAYRLDAAWQDVGSYRENVENNRYFISPAISFRPNDNTEFNLNIEQQRDREVYDYGQPAVGKHLADLPRKRSFIQDDASRYKNTLLDFNGSHKFDSGWKVSGGVLDSKQRNDLLDIYNYTRLQEGDTDVIRDLYSGNEKIDTRTIFVNVTGDVKTGDIKHKLLLGVERLSISNKQNIRDREIDTINIYTFNPSTRVDLAPLQTGDFDYVYNFQTRNNGFFAQDQIKFNDQWQVLLGIRHDRLKQDLLNYDEVRSGRNDSSTSPRVAVLYQLTQQLSLFANCAESFGIGFDYETNDLYKPQEARQCEVGAKTELLDGKLSLNTAIYDLTKTNIPTTDPANPTRSIAIGEANSRGLELDAQGKLTDTLSMIASYAYTDTEITKDGKGNVGNRLPYAPRNQYSLWLSYHPQGSTPDGLTLGGGVFGASQRYGDAANSYADDSYAKVDLFAAYRFKYNQTKLTAQLNVNNIFNEKFYYLRNAGSNLPSEPTSVQATLRADF
jgi:iron complex outermembrane recepter protein